jgi:hypothetical protein
MQRERAAASGPPPISPARAAFLANDSFVLIDAIATDAILERSTRD